MIDFLSMLNIDYKGDRNFIDDFIKEIIVEREDLKEWSGSYYNKIIDIKRKYTDSISLLVRSVVREENALDVRLFMPVSTKGAFIKSENVEVSFHSDNLAALALTESQGGGIPLAFLVINAEDYEDAIITRSKVHGIYLSAFSSEGMIVLPIEEDVFFDDEQEENAESVSSHFMESAGMIEKSMTEEEFYEEMTFIQKLFKTEDVLSVLEVYLFPVENVESMYSLLGIIESVDKESIRDSEGFIYRLRIKTMGISLDLLINEKDLLGEPEVGRRFKGNVWLQGRIDFV